MLCTEGNGTAKTALKWYMRKVLKEHDIPTDLQRKINRCQASVTRNYQEELNRILAEISKAVDEGNSKGNVAMNAANLLKSTRNLRQQLKTQLWQQLEVVEPIALRINMVPTTIHLHMTVGLPETCPATIHVHMSVFRHVGNYDVLLLGVGMLVCTSVCKE